PMFFRSGPGSPMPPFLRQFPEVYSTSMTYQNFIMKKNSVTAISRQLPREFSTPSINPNRRKFTLAKQSYIKYSKNPSRSLEHGQSMFQFVHFTLRNVHQVCLCSMRGFSISYPAIFLGH